MTLTYDEILTHSYRDFHATGLHYISMPWPLTGSQKGQGGYQKFYFFEDRAANMSEVVNPHNHRYMFSSTVLQGELIDIRYRPDAGISSRIYNRFDYMTPLNKGATGKSGFRENGLIRLREIAVEKIPVGRALISSPEDIHTIKVKADTVLSLIQYPDILDLNTPTQLYSLSDKAPGLEGLYKRWTMEQLQAYLWKLRGLVPLPNIM